MAQHKTRDRRYWVHSAPDAGDDSGQRPCARGRWCSAGSVEIVDGKRVNVPALGYRAFCDWDRNQIARRLGFLPELYVRLALAVGDRGQGGGGRSGKPESRLPMRLDVDAEQRRMAELLCSWEDRVRAVPRLSLTEADPDRARRRPARAVGDAAKLLRVNIDTLLGLDAGPMTRTVAIPIPADAAERFPGYTVIRSGDARKGDSYAVIGVDLDGARAGHDIFDLHFKAQRILGLTKPAPVRLPGVPCANPDCDRLALRRADPPERDDDPEWWSECAVCGDKMTRDEYDAWTKRYAAYLDSRAG